MENSSEHAQQSSSSWYIVAIICVLVLVGLGYFLMGDNDSSQTQVTQPPPKPEIIAEPEVEPESLEQDNIPLPEEVVLQPAETQPEDPEPVTIQLPSLAESDDWIRDKLPQVTWRKELLKLIIDDDMIRRFVVFTDNFARGNVVYEHSLLVSPAVKFTAKEVISDDVTQLVWDDDITNRFSLYVDLLRTLDSDLLVQWYFELKPLLDEAYAELGYPDEEFTLVLHDAITRVLDMEIPKEPIELVRPSVMYKFKDSSLERLPDADKLLLRIGRDNLLVIKSVLLEINEKLAKNRE
ncbi:DUF3014 domain-containing protein [Thalassotalea ganghwensis]